VHLLLDNLSFIVLLLVILLLVPAQVYILARKMSEPEKMLVPLPEGLPPEHQQIMAAYHDWLFAKNFEIVFVRRFGSIVTVTFKEKNAPRFVSIMFHQGRVTFAGETYFDDTDCTCLDTGTSGSTGLFPARPHQYKQSFPDATLDVAWQRHLGAEAYLVRRFGLRYQPLTLPYEEILLKAMRLQMQHVRSIPFYPFLALYWYFVSRSKAANRSIQQQFPPVAGEMPHVQVR
jgi:hypothetical protein